MKSGEAFWTQGRQGTLSALSQCKVWALTKMKEKHGVDLTLEDIAKEVWVIGKPRWHPNLT